MKEVWKKVLLALLIILFPVGIIYCIGKAFFADKRTWVTFLGILFLGIIAYLLADYVVASTGVSITQGIIDWFAKVIQIFKS